MKKIISVSLVLILLFTVTGCFIKTRQDEVLSTLGKYDSKESYTYGGFQDYTDFAKYTYSSVDFAQNQYFSPVSESDIESICAYLDDYERWIECHRRNSPEEELVVNYAFNRSIIDNADYFYIYSDPDYQSKYGNYDVYIFDTQTNTLYYFHNNI